MTLSRRAQDNIVAATLLAVFVLAAVISLNYGSRARLVPFAVAIAASVVTLAQLVLQNLVGADTPAVERRYQGLDPEGDPATTRTGDDVTVTKQPGGSMLGGFAVAGVFVAGIIVVGILPATTVYVFGYLLRIAKTPLLTAALYAVGSSLVLYLLFSVFLGIQLYPGVLGIWIPYPV